jgi:large subunit ribosomal protein L21
MSVRVVEVRMYAIIESGGKQHKVSIGDRIKVELLGAAQDEEVSFAPLMVADGDRVWAGPESASLKVSALVMAEGKRRKVLVFHKKRRKQYKKLRGHRQPFTEIKITQITTG